LGYPAVVEKKFHELLPQAELLKDKSIYLQILSQIALAQALQKKFDDAHKTLDEAQALLTPEYNLAQARIFLERGRAFHQAEKITEARNFFEKSFNLSKKYEFDFYAIDAAHMIAIVADAVADKIKWNQLAIGMVLSSQDKRSILWLGSLYNNLGRSYEAEKQFEKAFSAFEQALEYRKKEGYAPNIRVAKWSVARVLRLLDRLDDALAIQQELLKEYDAITISEKFDMPVEMFKLARGWVYEEIAELYHAKAVTFAKRAYDDLSNDLMFRTTESKRLERLKYIQKTDDATT
jgi:tetratricopeptide (TPR) repeat protein